MMDIKNAYEQLTNVDIEKQRQIWDERGKGYYGEYLLFCELYSSIAGKGKILMNLNIPTEYARTTEIDLILVHETGLYVFEIKHYKGTIYGDLGGENWTQYFRTAKNNKFRNPVKQNQYHIEALKQLFPDIPIRSCIVFTNPSCNLRILYSNANVDICRLGNVNQILEYRFSQSPCCLSMDGIDEVFDRLSIYSQMKKSIVIDNVEADFCSWVQPVVCKLELEKNNWRFKAEKLEKTRKNGIIFNIIIAIICILLSIMFCIKMVPPREQELDTADPSSSQTEESVNKTESTLTPYVIVSDASLELSNQGIVTFSAKLTINNDTYGVMLTENSKYIVMTKNGELNEYNVFGVHLKYNQYSNMLGKGIRTYGNLAKAKFEGLLDKSEVASVKITDITLFMLDVNRTVVREDMEIMLYESNI